MSHVQTITNDYGFVSSGTTAPITTTTGNSVILSCSAAQTVGTPVDSYGNAWAPYSGNPVFAGGSTYVYAWYCLHITGGANHTFTFTPTAAVQVGSSVSEFSGRSLAAIDNAASVVTGASNTQTGPTLAVTALADIWAVDCLTYRGAAVTWAAGSGFIIPTNGYVAASVQMPVCVEYANGASAGSYTPSLTNNSINAGGFISISLLKSAGAVLASTAHGVARASGALSSTPAPFAQILLNDPLHAGGSDMINMGTGPNTQTGDSAYVAFPKLIQWSADLNTMMSQLYPARSVQTPTTGFSIAPAPGVTLLVLNPAGTLAAGTIKMPPTPGDNQTFAVITSQTVTAATFNASAGQTLNGAPSTLPANTCVKWIYVAGLSTWFRLQ